MEILQKTLIFEFYLISSNCRNSNETCSSVTFVFGWLWVVNGLHSFTKTMFGYACIHLSPPVFEQSQHMLQTFLKCSFLARLYRTFYVPIHLSGIVELFNYARLLSIKRKKLVTYSRVFRCHHSWSPFISSKCSTASSRKSVRTLKCLFAEAKTITFVVVRNN